MKILLFGITNVGKSTIGKLLSEKLKYSFDDLDEEIKRKYKKIDYFKAKYPNDRERHKKRGEILYELINKYQNNVVIAVSPIFYKEYFEDILNEPEVLAIELQDNPENILSRLVYADENDNINPLVIKTKKEQNYYLRDIKADIKYYKNEYKIIKNKFNMNGETPEDVTERLIEYIKNYISEY